MTTSGGYHPSPISIDREQICYTMTATGATVQTGWARHDDSIGGVGIAYFTALGVPINPATGGFTQVVCERANPVTNYVTTGFDVAGGVSQTIVPILAGQQIVSWTARNRNATTATIRINGGQVLPLDTAESIGASVAFDDNDPLNDTIIINPGDGAVRMVVTRRPV